MQPIERHFYANKDKTTESEQHHERKGKGNEKGKHEKRMVIS